MQYKRRGKYWIMSQMARKNELSRLFVREKELEMQQKQLHRYRAFLMAQDSEDENDEQEQEDRCEENAELEQERVYLAEVSQERRNKMSTKNHRYR